MRSEIHVATDDGIRIAVSHYRRGNETLMVVSHGFYNSRNSASMRRVVQFLLPRYDVIVFDYRGHGQSSGKYTFGAREGRDLEAVLRYARLFPYKKRALMGFSLGAAIPVSVLKGKKFFDSLMLISCPWSFYRIDCHFWERPVLVSLRDLFGENGRARGARIGNPFLKKSPAGQAMPLIKAPVLFVHGQNDWLVKPWHSKALYGLTSREGRLEILQGGFHAEKLTEQFPDRFRRMSLDWFRRTLS